jgi:phage terminase large subunit-like protein
LVDPATAYAVAVTEGKTVAGRLVRLACERHLRDMEEGPKRGLRWDVGLVRRVVEDFFPRLELPEGAGLFVLQPFQAFIVGSLFGWVRDDGYRRFRTAYIEIGKGNGKALALDTQIPTPTGWTTMEELEAGDLVFDENGRACTVVAAHPVLLGNRCYRVKFDDGTSIVANAEHLWFTEQRRFSGDRGAAIRGVPRTGRGRWRKGIRTTEEIAQTLRYPNGRYQSVNHSIPLAGALELPDAVLPIEPYALGVWLGDGDSDGARVTVGAQDIEELIGELRATGTDCGDPRATGGGNCWRVRVGGAGGRRGRNGGATMNAALRREGLLGNKHIPPRYLRASARQRLALLQGLMDTDGTIGGIGSCEFSSKSTELAQGAMELILGLGMKATFRTVMAKIDGREIGPHHRIQFYPPHDLPVFRLGRKLARQTQRHFRRRLSGDRRIVSCEPVESVPVRCISVDSPSRLYLAGRSMVPTHNSPLGAGILLYGVVADGEQDPQCFAAAVTRDQANIALDDALKMAENSAFLRDVLDVSRFQRGGGHIVCRSSGGFVRAVSSEHRGLDGKRPHIALIDELHEHKTPSVAQKIRLGTKGRKQALIVEATNSGFDQTTVCWEHHLYSQQILEQKIESDGHFGYVCGLDPCAKHLAEGATAPAEDCEDCDDWRDEAVWPKASPGLDTILPRRYLREAVAEAEGMPGQQSLVKRLNFCIWTQGSAGWLGKDLWARNAWTGEWPDLTGRTCYVGIDLASTEDTTCVSVFFPDPEIEASIEVEEAEAAPAETKDEERPASPVVGGWLVERFFLPEEAVLRRVKQGSLPYDVWEREGWIVTTPGSSLDYDAILDYIDELVGQYQIGGVAIDPWNASSLENSLMGRGLAVVRVPPHELHLTEPTRRFEALAKRGMLRHRANPVMGWQVGNVVVDRDPRGGLKISKKRSSEKVDGPAAAVLAISRAMLAPVESEYDGELLSYA